MLVTMRYQVKCRSTALYLLFSLARATTVIQTVLQYYPTI